MSDLRAALKDLLSYCAKYVDDPDASEDEQIVYDDVHIRLAQLLGQHPASGGPERDYEPGTRFVVVEIPPAASDKEADEITEKVFEAAHDIDAQYTGPWDLFIYRQHNAPPANIPASGGPAVTDGGITDEMVEAGARALFEDQDGYFVQGENEKVVWRPKR